MLECNKIIVYAMHASFKKEAWAAAVGPLSKCKGLHFVMQPFDYSFSINNHLHGLLLQAPM
jgi:hypothetical protein